MQGEAVELLELRDESGLLQITLGKGDLPSFAEINLILVRRFNVGGRCETVLGRYLNLLLHFRNECLESRLRGKQLLLNFLQILKVLLANLNQLLISIANLAVCLSLKRVEVEIGSLHKLSKGISCSLNPGIQAINLYVD